MDPWKPRTKLSDEGEAILRTVLSDPERRVPPRERVRSSRIFLRRLTPIAIEAVRPRADDVSDLRLA